MDSVDIYYCPFPLSIEEEDKDLTISVYPNPTMDLIHLKTPTDLVSNCEFTIVGIAGNEVREKVQLTSHHTKIDVRHLKQGVYFIQLLDIQTQQIENNIKVILQKH